MKKRILSMILCFCMVISLLPGITVPAAAESSISSSIFGSGQDGSLEAPYQISSIGSFNIWTAPMARTIYFEKRFEL